MNNHNLLKSIVLKKQFKSDKFLFINPSLYCKEKDKKFILSSIQMIHAMLEFDEIVIYIKSKNQSDTIVMTEDGIYSPKYGFISFSELPTTEIEIFSDSNIDELKYKTVKLIAEVIKERISQQGLIVNETLDEKLLLEQANIINQHKMSFWLKIYYTVMLLAATPFILIIIVVIVGSIQDRFDAAAKREQALKARNEQVVVTNNKLGVLETKIAKSIGQDKFLSYKQQATLDTLYFILEKDRDFSKTIDIYQTNQEFTYRFDDRSFFNLLGEKIEMVIPKYSYLIIHENKMYFNRKDYKLQQEELTKVAQLVVDHSKKDNLLVFLKSINDRTKSIQQELLKLPESKDTDFNRAYIYSQTRMLDQIKDVIEKSSIERYIIAHKVNIIVFGVILFIIIFIFIQYNKARTSLMTLLFENWGYKKQKSSNCKFALSKNASAKLENLNFQYVTLDEAISATRGGSYFIYEDTLMSGYKLKGEYYDRKKIS